MKTLRYILPLILAFSTINLRAQDMSDVPDSIFCEYVKSLKNRGNDYYMLYNRIGIRQVIDEYLHALEARKAKGNLAETKEGYYRQDITKLSGDYHYLNSDYDRQSYAEAEKCFKQYLDYYQSHSEDYVAEQGKYVAHQELAQLYYKQSRYEEACDEMKEVMAVVSMYKRDEDEPFDKQSQYAICLARVNQFDEAISNINEVLDNYENINTERFGEALRKKAKILMLREEHVGKIGKSEALDYYKQYFGLKKKDALAHFMGMNSEEREMYWMKIRPFVTDCYRLEDADAGFLYDVTLFAKGLLLQLDSTGGGRQNIHATWQMVQEKLKPDACAIEFIQYEKYGKQQMGALVLKNTGEPIFVKMVSPDSLWGHKIGDYTVRQRLSCMGKDGFDAINRVYNDSTGLYRIIWNKALLAAIGNSKKIYFAPDGYLHRVAIEYMLPEPIAQKAVFRLSSTRRILNNNIKSDMDKALIIGDVDFNATGMPEGENNDAKAFQIMKGLSFPEIKDSKAEIDSIVSCRKTNADLVLTKEQANENMFRTVYGEYPILHLSTHGKLMTKDVPFGTDLKPCVADESLSENIIALAGINSSLKDEQFNPGEYYDGILSAKEIASMDMRKAQLVILACCESGLGQITPDGVYGIQRGLKNAGAGAIVMSLWDATSQTTTRFMTAFHKKIKNGVPIGEAFRNTRLEMWNQSEYYDQEPCYWNVFVLIDAIE